MTFSMKKQQVCERCYCTSEKLYELQVPNEEGDWYTIKVCWDCDFDIINGRGEVDEDPADIFADRQEEAYEFDPINEVRPY